MDSTRNWYYSIGSDRHGPVDEATLKALARTGKLKPNDRVWHPDFDDWRVARDIPEIPFIAGGAIAVNFLINPSQSRK